jgi:hypothetical protein
MVERQALMSGFVLLPCLELDPLRCTNSETESLRQNTLLRRCARLDHTYTVSCRIQLATALQHYLATLDTAECLLLVSVPSSEPICLVCLRPSRLHNTHRVQLIMLCLAAASTRLTTPAAVWTLSGSEYDYDFNSPHD